MKRMLICLFCLTVIFSFTGCYGLLDALLTSYYLEEDLAVSRGIDSKSYEYSEKVRLSMCNEPYDDELEIRINIENQDTYASPSYPILSGKFEKFAWNDYKLYVVMNTDYYVFDIAKHTVPPYSESADYTYELLQYTKDEFISLYPNYKNFNWKTSNTIYDEIYRTTDINITSKSEFITYDDQRNNPETDYYFKGSISLCDEDESVRTEIKNNWINHISESPMFNEIEKVAFSKDVIPFSDDYYYYYKNDYYDNRDSDFYYGDYFNIFAYDDKTMTLYFYISD